MTSNNNLISNNKILITPKPYNYYFIHNYKTSGTSIYHQLPQDYNNLYYGLRSFENLVVNLDYC
jgi:hypothetical protein